MYDIFIINRIVLLIFKILNKQMAMVWMGCRKNSWICYLHDILAGISTWKLKILVRKQCIAGIAKDLWKRHSRSVIICVKQNQKEGSVLWFFHGCFVTAYWKCLLYSSVFLSLTVNSSPATWSAIYSMVTVFSHRC